MIFPTYTLMNLILALIRIPFIGEILLKAIGTIIGGGILYFSYMMIDRLRYHWSTKGRKWRITPSGIYYFTPDFKSLLKTGDSITEVFGIRELLSKLQRNERLSEEEKRTLSRPKVVRLPPITVDVPIRFGTVLFSMEYNTLTIGTEEITDLDLPESLSNLSGEWKTEALQPPKGPEGYTRYQVNITRMLMRDEDFRKNFLCSRFV